MQSHPKEHFWEMEEKKKHKVTTEEKQNCYNENKTSKAQTYYKDKTTN